MTSTSSHPTSGAFHEWPLVVFTTLAIMGAGLLATPLVAWLAAGSPAPAARAVRLGVLLLGAGLAVSTAHLGRPFRAPLAAAGVGRSRLSAEVVVAGVALMLGIATALLPDATPVLGFTTATAALAFLIALGLVYALPGQQTWRGATAWMPLSGGLLFSPIALAVTREEIGTALTAAIAVLLACDTALLVMRYRSLERPQARLAPSYPHIFARRRPMLAARFLLVDILPACGLLAGLPSIAAGLLGLGILIDRVAFYGFASQHTTEAEVQRVEGLIGSRG
jgi:DMSO reductase anchor subunit